MDRRMYYSGNKIGLAKLYMSITEINEEK